MAEETDDELAVLADELQQRGDPLGEVVGTHLALAHLPDTAPNARRGVLERKIATLLDVHHDALYGALAPHVQRASRPDLIDPAIEVTRWRAGFAEEVVVRSTLRGPVLDEVYRHVRTLPILRRARSIVVGVGLGPAFAAAIVADPPPRLRELVLRMPMNWRGPREEGLDDLGPLVPLCARLEVLRIERRMTSPPLVSSTLQRLSYIHQREGEPFSRSELPRLVELTMSGGAIEVGFCDRFPALEQLRLYDATFGDAFLVQLLASPAIERLRELHLWLRDADQLELIARAAHRIAHLDKVSLRGFFRREVIDAFRPRMPACVELM